MTALCVALAAAGVAVAGYDRGAAPAAQPRPAAKGGKGCSGALGSNVYRCTVVGQDGAPFEDCLRFTSPGEVSDVFDLTSDQLGSQLGCSCLAGGSSKKPKFGGSKTFLCHGDDYAFQGVANGKAIKKGFASSTAGAPFAFQCKVDAACAVTQ